MPKRKISEVAVTPPGSEADESSNSSGATDGSVDVSVKGCFRQTKKAKRFVNFDGVKVFYFPRIQGFTCIPSEGGSTLGMGDKHAFEEDFTLGEYTKEQKRVHKMILEEQKQQGKLMHLLKPSKPITQEEKSDSDRDSDSDSESDPEVDEYYFLQPVPIRQRRLLLRQSGVKKIDGQEKEECKTIRVSREVCGCDCKVFCDPATCACSLAGITCQVDRLSFPCGCTKDGCGNQAGRIEFNPIRVRTHFIHTLMRLELERKDAESKALKAQRQCLQDGSAQTQTPKDEQAKELVPTDDTGDEDQWEFNSNEKGSCRDCQNSEICHVMMQEAQAQYARTLENEQRCLPQQQQQHFTPDLHGVTLQSIAPPAGGIASPMPRVLLFSDNEEEFYGGDNSASIFHFKQEESSYSESSDCSSENSIDNSNNYNKSYQNLATFDSGTTPNGSSAGFCAEDSGTVVQSAPQKYIDLNNSPAPGMFKLEPIGGVLNGVRPDDFAATVQPAGLPAWSENGETPNYAPCAKAYASPSPTQPPFSYTTMTDTTSDLLAEKCPGISSHMKNQNLSKDANAELAPFTSSSSGSLHSDSDVLCGGSLDSFPLSPNQTTDTMCSSLGSETSRSPVYMEISASNGTGHENGTTDLTKSLFSFEKTDVHLQTPKSVDLKSVSLSGNLGIDFSTEISASHSSDSDGQGNFPSASLKPIEGKPNFGELIKESLVETAIA